MATKNYASLPMILTITNADPGVIDKAATFVADCDNDGTDEINIVYETAPSARDIQLYKVNRFIRLNVGDSVKLLCNTSEEISFYKEVLDSNIFTIAEDPCLGTLTVTSTGTGATAIGDTVVSITESAGTGNSFVYKLGTVEAPVAYDDDLSSWTALPNGGNLTPAATDTIVTVAEVTADSKAVNAGSATIVKKTS